MDFDLVVLKPAELILKSKQVRGKFEKRLIQNIRACLKQNNVEFDYITRLQARYLIYSPEPEDVAKWIKFIFGISKFFKAVEVGARLDAINTAAAELASCLGLNKRKSFGVRVSKTNSPLKSRDVEREVGKFIQKKFGSKVNLTNPNIWIRIEIVGGKAFIFSKEEVGLGGLPLSVSGKVVVLMGGGIKDVVAAWMMMRRGCEVFPLHLHSDESALVRFQKNCKLLEKFAWGSKIKVRVISKKFSLKTAVKEAEKYAMLVGAKGIVLGSLKPKLAKGGLPIFEPLVGLEKKQLQIFSKFLI